MNPKDPVILVSIETQMMASMLHFGIQFVDPISDVDNTKLSRLLVNDMQRTMGSGVFDQTEVDALLKDWFARGRIYEMLPEDATQLETADIPTSQAALLLERVPSAMAAKAIRDLRLGAAARFFDHHGSKDAFCRLMWMWFQWGRSYQKGNEHPPTTPLS